MVKTLYHISRDVDIIKEFIPRIPKDRAVNEDDMHRRVCLSSSIEGCLTAVPWGGANIDGIFFDIGDASHLIRVYEFDVSNINPEDLISSSEIYKAGLVYDADITQEYWFIGEKLTPDRTYLIEIDTLLKRWTDVYSYENETYILANEDNMSSEEIESLVESIIDEIYHVEYSIVPEDKCSDIIRRSYLLDHGKKINLNRVRLDLESIFGCDANIELEVVGKMLNVVVDTCNFRINIDRFNDLMSDML